MIEAEYDKWRQHVELNKFTGPTIKLLRLEHDLWAILDHEYNFIFTGTALDVAYRIFEVQHPPQRERPKPKVYEYPDLPTQIKHGDQFTVRFNINTDDLDL